MIIEIDGGYCSSHDPSQIFTRRRDAAQLDARMSFRQSTDVKKDLRKLEELITIWFRMHGKTLRDGVKRRSLLQRICDRLGNPIASAITANDFAAYRETRTLEVTPATANREHAYFSAMFNELARLGVIDFANPVASMRKFKEREGELRYLSHDEIALLLKACRRSTNPSLIYIVKICLATGARWDEAESLKHQQIKDGKVTFLQTKSGRNRSVPIKRWLFNELTALEPVDNRRLFLSSVSAFRKAVQRAGLELPRGQLTHVLRHTFASHFVIGGGNIVKLKEILGHSEITTTMRYAHLAPEHLEEARELNPLNMHHR